MSKKPVQQEIAEDGVIDINTADEAAPVPATTRPKCECCEPPVDLDLGVDGVPFAFCRPGNKIYHLEEDGSYKLTDYKVDRRRIVDADGKQVFPKLEEGQRSPCTDDILGACRDNSDDQAGAEEAGGSEPNADQRERVDISRSGYH